jgi:ribosomal-protein-alanine acetyltransferase
MNFTLRPMQLEDINAVVLVDAIAGILLPWSPAAYAGELRKPSSWCWVAETVTDEPLEYRRPMPVAEVVYPAGAPAVIGSLTLWDVAGEGEVANVSVHPQFWRQGVGRALMGVALEQAARLGLRKVMLEVRASNAPAKTLYESLGFVEVGQRPHYYSNGEDAILMSRVEK